MECVECGKPHDDPSFCYYGGVMDYGPAYWSDEGILCSPQCATAHFLKREAAKNPMVMPAPKPGIRG